MKTANFIAKYIYMKNLYLFIAASLLTIISFGQNQIPVISDFTISEIDEENEELLIQYSLADQENDPVEITLFVSNNNGETYSIDTQNATGDIGTGINSGINKTITWNYTGLINLDDTHIIKLVADDQIGISIQDIVDQVDSVSILNYLEQIVGVRHRTTNSVHLEEVQDLFEQSIINNDLDLTVQNFTFGGYIASNYIGKLEGISNVEEEFILDGHYDSVDDSPGADDNGSAVAGVLEAMRILSQYNFEKTIKFIGFDLEEPGLKGSIDYVTNEENPLTSILGVINFEMIGYYDNEPNSQEIPFGFDFLFPDAVSEILADSSRGNFINNIAANDQGDYLHNAYNNAAATYVPDLKVITIVTPTNIPDLRRSDHAPFWDSGVPALQLTDGANFRNPYYHTPNDTIGTLNMTFMTNVVKAAVGMLAEEAVIKHSSFETTTLSPVSSINNYEFNCNLSILMKPSLNKIIVSFDHCNSFVNSTQFKLISIDGKEVFHKTIHDFGKVEIDTQGYSKGAYFIQVRNGLKTTQHKIVIQ